MDTLVQVFREGGAGMYLALGAGIVAWGLSTLCVVAIVGIKKRTPLLVLGIVTFLAALFLVVAGFAFYSYGMYQVESAIIAASPEFVDRLREEGTRMARYPLIANLIAASVPFFTSIATLVRWKGTPS